MVQTYRIYFAQGNQALLSATIEDVFKYLMANNEYYHDIKKIEFVEL